MAAEFPDRADVVIRTQDGATSAGPSSFVARVEWSEHERRALLRTSNGVEREIRFSDGDAPAERGRTVGFALASMVPDELFSEPSRPAPLPPPCLSPCSHPGTSESPSRRARSASP